MEQQVEPVFLLEDPVCIAYWSCVYREFPGYQLAVMDAARHTVIGIVNTIPLAWDAPLSELPEEGWDWALSHADTGGAWQCALLAAIAPEYRGQGLAESALRAARQLGRAHGHQGMLVPVRPTRKAEFVQIPMDEYIAKRTQDGRVFDPWLRLHLEMGARLIKICHRAMTIQLPWEKWLEYGATAGGVDELIIPHGLVPIQRQADGSGLYVEPNVWVAHEV